MNNRRDIETTDPGDRDRERATPIGGRARGGERRARRRRRSSPADEARRRAEAERDLDLLAAWKTGDKKAGEALLARYYQILRKHFVNKVQRDQVDDLVQKAAIACFEAFARFEGRSSVRTYVLKIAHNILARHYRTKRRKRDREDPMLETVEAMSSGVFTKTARRADQQMLLESLRRLQLQDQTVLELYYLQRNTGPECAEILEIPLGTFRNRLRRAKARLKIVLEEGRGTAEQKRRSHDSLETLGADLDAEADES